MLNDRVRLARRAGIGVAAAALAVACAATALPSTAHAAEDGEPAAVHPDLVTAAAQRGAGPVTAVLVLDAQADLDPIAGNHDAVVAELKRIAQTSQAAVTAELARRDIGVRVQNALWITNALIVELPSVSAATELTALSVVPGIARIIPNFTVTTRDPVTTASTKPPTVGGRTWGIDRIRAHRVWDEFGVDGAGVRVAVLDTGVDINHPDLIGKMATDDRSDPTYPGGWMQFDSNGNVVRSRPFDDEGHGTHVTGTIVGGNSSGISIGVAPGASVMHGQILPTGEGTFAQVAAGMQWAIDPVDAEGEPAGRPADVVNMSVGLVGFTQEIIAPTQAIRAAGVFPAISIGNSCPAGLTANPGNVYEAVGVGATDQGDTVADFSCGGVVQRTDWPDPPAEWPQSYVKPDLTAPGVDTLSALPGGVHGLNSGTSMAAPHVAGTAALMRSAATDLTVDETVDALVATAYFDERHGSERPNPRFGHGRIDAYAAVRQVAGGSGVTGRVTDVGSGAPIAGVAVTVVETGGTARTGIDGEFTRLLPPGSYTLDVAGFTYGTSTIPNVVVTADTFTTVNVELAPGPAGTLSGRVTYAPSGHGVPGATVRVLDAPIPLSAVTDADGAYRFDRLPPGTYRLQAIAAQLPVSAAVDGTVVASGHNTAGLTLTRPAEVRRISESSDGQGGDSAASSVSITSDGRYAVFDSYSSNLVPGDTNFSQDIFVRDLQSGELSRVSVTTDGGQADSSSSDPVISADGRYVAFQSYASNLVPGDSPFTSDVFVHDRVTGETTAVSVSSDGALGNALSWAPTISADGRYIAFGSFATNLAPGDPPFTEDVFVHDQSTDQTERLSVSMAGTSPNGSSKDPAISANGRYVAFVSAASDLVEGDTNGREDVFVRDRDTGAVTRVSVPSGGGESDSDSAAPAVSADGRIVAFHSLASNLVDGDGNATYDAFVHDRSTGQTELVSVASDGTRGNDSSTGVAVSADGRYVSFGSGASNLVLGDTNGAYDVFVRDRELGQTVRVSVRSDGTEGNRLSLAQSISGDGRLVGFYSEATNFVAGDTNFAPDVFIADRFPTGADEARFAVFDLQVAPRTVKSNEPVAVSVGVKNIGVVPGDQQLTLTVDGAAEQSATIDLAAGAVETVSWTVSRPELGSYDIRVGRLFSDFRVRPPIVDLSLTTVSGRGLQVEPLAAAAVSLVQADGRLVPVGATGSDGRLSFETTAADGAYAIVAQRQATDRHPFGYLLVRSLQIGDDLALAMEPVTTGGTGRKADPPPADAHLAAVVDLSLDPVGEGHQGWTYLRPESAGPIGFGFGPQRVVVTVGGYELRDVQAIRGFERDWWGVSDVVSGLDFRSPTSYAHEYGGPARAELTVTGAGTEFTATWAVVDQHGNPFTLMAETGVRPFHGLPAAVTLESLPTVVASTAPNATEVILRVFDRTGAQIHGGGLDWSQRQVTRDLAEMLDEVQAGRYRLELAVDTGAYPPGDVGAKATFSVR